MTHTDLYVKIGMGVVLLVLIIFFAKKIWPTIIEFKKWIKTSFEEGGKASAKKITAFVFSGVVVVLELRYLWYSMRTEQADRFQYLMDIINSDLLFIASLLGIKAVTEIASKMGKKTTEPEQPVQP